jgi:hypothetical protein
MTEPEAWTAAQTARIDWPKVLDDIAYLLGDPLPTNELLRASVSQEKLADALDAPRGTVRGWIDGSEPKHSDGERILAYWSRLTGKARTFAPVDRYVFSAAKVPKTTGLTSRQVNTANDSGATTRDQWNTNGRFDRGDHGGARACRRHPVPACSER